VELDVQGTADDALVVLHDTTTGAGRSRRCGAGSPIYPCSTSASTCSPATW
jgi:glycerophosphoryl diester phosphodiesterase